MVDWDKKNKKRGQLFSQPFIYIFMLIVMGLLLFFGYKAISGVKDLSCEVEFVKFMGDFEDEIELFYTLDIGSSKLIDMHMGCGDDVNYICFIDRDRGVDYELVPDKMTGDLMRVVIGKNVFFVPFPTADRREAVYFEHIKPIGGNPLCIRTINRLKARIESKGRYVGISEVDE